MLESIPTRTWQPQWDLLQSRFPLAVNTESKPTSTKAGAATHNHSRCWWGLPSYPQSSLMRWGSAKAEHKRWHTAERWKILTAQLTSDFAWEPRGEGNCVTMCLHSPFCNEVEGSSCSVSHGTFSMGVTAFSAIGVLTQEPPEEILLANLTLAEIGTQCSAQGWKVVCRIKPQGPSRSNDPSFLCHTVYNNILIIVLLTMNIPYHSSFAQHSPLKPLSHNMNISLNLKKNPVVPSTS